MNAIPGTCQDINRGHEQNEQNKHSALYADIARNSDAQPGNG
jgi:hypothetical protein